MALNRQQIEQLSEPELIAGFQQTKQRIYVSLLYRRYEHLVYGNCLKYLKNHHDIEDIVAEVFEKVILKLPSTHVKSFADWLFIITRNACLSKLRKRNIEESSSDNWTEVEKKSEHFMENAALVRLMNKHTKEDRLQLLHQALEELADEQRTCIKLFFLESRSYREIESITGMPINKVKSMLQNGKRNLRIQLNKKIATINFWLLLALLLF